MKPHKAIVIALAFLPLVRVWGSPIDEDFDTLVDDQTLLRGARETTQASQDEADPEDELEYDVGDHRLLSPGPIDHSMWVHGNAAVVENPEDLSFQKYFGYYNRVIGKMGTTNRIHFAIPTPVLEDQIRLKADAFRLRATIGNAVMLRRVHIYDGSTLIAVHNGVNHSGSFLAWEPFEVDSKPEIHFGLSVSLYFSFFNYGTDSQRTVNLISAGFDLKL